MSGVKKKRQVEWMVQRSSRNSDLAERKDAEARTSSL